MIIARTNRWLGLHCSRGNLVGKVWGARWRQKQQQVVSSKIPLKTRKKLVIRPTQELKMAEFSSVHKSSCCLSRAYWTGQHGCILSDGMVGSLTEISLSFFSSLTIQSGHQWESREGFEGWRKRAHSQKEILEMDIPYDTSRNWQEVSSSRRHTWKSWGQLEERFEDRTGLPSGNPRRMALIKWCWSNQFGPDWIQRRVPSCTRTETQWLLPQRSLNIRTQAWWSFQDQSPHIPRSQTVSRLGYSFVVVPSVTFPVYFDIPDDFFHCEDLSSRVLFPL